MNSKPKGAYTPPFRMHQIDTYCQLELYAYSDDSDYFSWEDVRLLAQEILEFCKEDGLSLGGRARIGNGKGWEVAVHGRLPDVPLTSSIEPSSTILRSVNSATVAVS